MLYSHETKSKLGSWVQNILPVSIAAEVTRTTNSLELSWCILQLFFKPQNIPQKQCPRKCCCSLSIMFPRGKCWVIDCRGDEEKLLFLFWYSFGGISFLIVSYVFTYILLKHLKACESRCPGIEKKKIKMKLKILSMIRIAAFCMWIAQTQAKAQPDHPCLSDPIASPSTTKNPQIRVPTNPSPLSSELVAPAMPSLCLPHATGLAGETAQTLMASTASPTLAYIKRCFMSSDAPFNEEMRRKNPPLLLPSTAEHSSLLLPPLQITGILSLIIRLNK